MSKKMKIIVSVLVAVLLLSAGGTAVAMAKEDSRSPVAQQIKNGFLSRVAQILGISEEKLTGAMKQARQEIRQEEFEKLLNEAVKKGVITEEEAGQLREWWQNRPAALNRILSAVRFRQYKELLDKAVKNGRITQDEADKIKQWWESRPRVIDRLLPKMKVFPGLIEKFKKQQEKREPGTLNALSNIIDKAVARGIITNEEAGKIKEWWQSRPEAVNRLLSLELIVKGPFDKLVKLVDQAVKKGRISESDAAKIKEWWGKRTEALKRLLPGSILPSIHPQAKG